MSERDVGPLPICRESSDPGGWKVGGETSANTVQSRIGEAELPSGTLSLQDLIQFVEQLTLDTGSRGKSGRRFKPAEAGALSFALSHRRQVTVAEPQLHMQDAGPVRSLPGGTGRNFSRAPCQSPSQERQQEAPAGSLC